MQSFRILAGIMHTRRLVTKPLAQKSGICSRVEVLSGLEVETVLIIPSIRAPHMHLPAAAP